jgi:hypothetical protein
LAAIFGLGGCRAVPDPELQRGASAVRFVEHAPAPARDGAITANESRQPVTVLEPPRPIEPLTLPEYPTVALGRQQVPVVISVRLAIDAEGVVTEVRRSPLALSLPAAHADLFFAAVEHAAKTWRFTPAELRDMTPRAGGPQGSYWHVTRVEKTTATVDVEFTFTASGQVWSGRR